MDSVSRFSDIFTSLGAKLVFKVVDNEINQLLSASFSLSSVFVKGPNAVHISMEFRSCLHLPNDLVSSLAAIVRKSNMVKAPNGGIMVGIDVTAWGARGEIVCGYRRGYLRVGKEGYDLLMAILGDGRIGNFSIGISWDTSTDECQYVLRHAYEAFVYGVVVIIRLCRYTHKADYPRSHPKVSLQLIEAEHIRFGLRYRIHLLEDVQIKKCPVLLNPIRRKINVHLLLYYLS